MQDPSSVFYAACMITGAHLSLVFPSERQRPCVLGPLLGAGAFVPFPNWGHSIQQAGFPHITFGMALQLLVSGFDYWRDSLLPKELAYLLPTWELSVGMEMSVQGVTIKIIDPGMTHAATKS